MPKRYKGPGSMSVQELIDALEEIDPEDRDMPILFACDYGDYGHTTQVLGITELMYGTQPIEESGYSQSRWALVKPNLADEYGPPDSLEEDEVEIEEGPKAFILQ